MRRESDAGYRLRSECAISRRDSVPFRFIFVHSSTRETCTDFAVHSVVRPR
jgi:hypothetical protein